MNRTHAYAVTVRWTGNRGAGTAGYKAYDRAHEVTTEGKQAIAGSADPAFYGTKDRWNPEELLVAALSQCHMLSYLALAARDGLVVTSYRDDAVGQMTETAGWSGHFTEVVLRPVVTVADPSTVEKALDLHHAAHQTCFIANSVNFPVRHEPRVSADSV